MNKFIFRRLIFKFFCHFLSFKKRLSGSNSRIEYDLKFFRLISKFKKTFSFKINNHKMVCGLSQSGLGWHIYLHETFEEDALRLCKEYIKPDSIVLDIGANIGIQSVFYSQLATEGRVYAFDPSRYSYEFLLKNTRSIPHIVPLNFGMSNETGFIDFFENENDSLSSIKNTMRGAIRAKSRIMCYKGDDFVKLFGIEKVSFIKIDVEGLEYEVLQGLQETLETSKPVVFCEIYEGSDSNVNAEETIQFLCNMGYKAFVIDDKELVPFVRHDDRKYNYIFIDAVGESQLSKTELEYSIA